MLYVTTRSDREVFTPSHTLRDSCGKGGGFYVPFRIPSFPQPDSDMRVSRSFADRVEEMIRLLFHADNGREILKNLELSRSVQMVPAGQKMIAVKLPEEAFLRFRKDIFYINGMEDTRNCPSDWTSVAVWICLFYGILNQLRSKGILENGQKLEISLSCKHFSALMGALYVRSMNLPVGRIICGCDEESPLWELLRQGQLKVRDECLPDGIERLIHWAGGCKEVNRFLEAYGNNGSYHAPENVVSFFMQELYSAVASCSRVAEILANFSHTELRILSSNGALAYAGVQDYRSMSGTRELALIVSD